MKSYVVLLVRKRDSGDRYWKDGFHTIEEVNKWLEDVKFDENEWFRFISENIRAI